MKRLTVLLIVLMGLAAFSPLQAQRRQLVMGLGGGAGATIDPDQVHLGLYADLGEVYEKVRIRPSFEVGFGDNVTTLALNPEAIYLFRGSRTDWYPYAGAGLGFVYYDFDTGYGNPDRDGGDWDVGAWLIGGLETWASRNSKFFLELKLGPGGTPDARFTAGFTVMMR